MTIKPRIRVYPNRNVLQIMRMTSRSLGHRAPLLWIVVPMIAGLAIGRLVDLESAFWSLGIALVAAVSAIVASWRAERWTTTGIVVAMFAAGLASYALHQQHVASLDGMPPREGQVSLQVERMFTPKEGARSVSGFGRIIRADVHLPELRGQQIYFSARWKKGDALPIRSEVIAVIGKIESLPRVVQPASFESYLADEGVCFTLRAGRILAVERPPSGYRVWLEHAAAKLNALLESGVDRKRHELTAIYRAMMLGQKSDLDREQTQLFMQSGTMHLFAINGLHIGVVAMALHALLTALRCPRPAAAIVTLAVLWLDVDTTGASPSAVRAWLLVAAYESAYVLRRPANGLASLATAALVVMLFDPFAVFSASFQMSYGAVLAILCFGIPLADDLTARLAPWKSLPEVSWSPGQKIAAGALRWFWPVLGIGLAASLVSTLTGPQFFRVLAAGGFLTNLVLVPPAMLVIVAGFASIVVGLLGIGWLGLLFNHAAVLLLWGIDAWVRIGVRAPGGWWAAEWRAPWIGSAALAALLIAFLAGYMRGWRGWACGWWTPFAVVGVAVIFGVKFG